MILAQHFAPEEVGGAVLATDLTERLLANGHEVTFVTAAPSYPGGVVFGGYRNRILSCEKRNDASVIRVWSAISKRKSLFRRVASQVTFSMSTLLCVLVARRPDVILCYSPPFPLGVAAACLAARWGSPWLLRIEDLYPEAAVAAGVVRSKHVVALLRVVERWLYREASHISVISGSVYDNLVRKGVEPKRLSVTSVWSDPSRVRPLLREQAPRELFGLKDEFVVMYAGNLGHTSSVEWLLEAAIDLKNLKDLKILVVGEGIRKKEFESRVARERVSHIQFSGYLPKERLAELLAIADVGVVTLSSDAAAFSLPNKLFNTMASGRAVLAIAPVESALGRIVAEEGCGLVVEPGNAKRVAEAIMQLKESAQTREEMGRAGRSAVEGKFSADHCIAELESDLARLVERRRDGDG